MNNRFLFPAPAPIQKRPNNNLAPPHAPSPSPALDYTPTHSTPHFYSVPHSHYLYTHVLTTNPPPSRTRSVSVPCSSWSMIIIILPSAPGRNLHHNNHVYLRRHPPPPPLFLPGRHAGLAAQEEPARAGLGRARRVHAGAAAPREPPRPTAATGHVRLVVAAVPLVVLIRVLVLVVGVGDDGPAGAEAAPF
ncbi:hypothetical protein BC826DRAFT_997915, partial [Russula brevipes]